MDTWVVVAAASAVYLSKQWQKFLRNRENSLRLIFGTSEFEKLNSASKRNFPDKKSCPLRGLDRERKLDGVSIEREHISRVKVSEMTQLDGTPAADMASASGVDGEKLVSLGNHKDCNVLLVSSLAAGFSRNDNPQENEDGIRMTGDINSSGDFVPGPSTGYMNPFFDLSRKRRALRTKRLHARFTRPISSLESCLLAQLYNEHTEMEEYVLRSLQSPPASNARSLSTSDGSRIVNKASGDSLSMQIGSGDDNLPKEANLGGRETAHGIPSLPKVRSMELPRRSMKLKTGRGQRQKLGSSSKMINRKYFQLKGGSPDGMVLFCLGISIGMIFSQISNKRKVDEMKELLQQTENLVQDLQEELEMKGSLTVKELANEDYESQDTHDHAFGSEAHEDYESQDAHDHVCLDGPPNRFSSEPCDQKEEENSELMSKIEAELEAELERLELSMNSSCLERKLSSLVELDPDIEADFVQGELRVEMFGRQTDGGDDSYQDVSSTSTTHSAYHAVSPRELSLRLHEVIQSRLEERVKELEMELQNKARQLQFMESEHLACDEEFADSILSSSTRQTPITLPVEESNPIAQLLAVNLSEDAYNEVDDYFMKEPESGSEDFPSAAHRIYHQDGLHQFDGSVLPGREDLLKANQSEEEDQESSHQFDVSAVWDQNGRVGDSMEHPTINKEKHRRTFVPQGVRTLEEHILMDRELSEDENDDDDDEDEDDEMRLLIQQIVEKSRQGSPMVLNAQRAFFPVDGNEH